MTVNKKAEEEFYKCQFKFINNAALPDSIVDNAHFRAMIKYAIDNANLLKKLKHMGPRKFISIQFASFDGLLRTVSTLVQSVRDWQIKNIVSHYVWYIVELHPLPLTHFACSFAFCW